ncbi:TonB-dependent receptor domain-containing protein [Proteiniphilum sp.]|uniref:TonB-dependent receptor domain-containing protein n=1 Tax=Proteiniphilum sp. TaxID=1926877 RepID=UPI002B20F7D9|nr:TonB-dependent receptor [Proteiniphilum sp.]MEA4916891.1 TonB-dependent receptor [Proteiniphilum sp.]
MSRFLIVILVVFASIHCVAQQSVVSGQIIDEKSKEIIPYATIVVSKKSTGDMVTGAMNDEEGRFSFTGLPIGEYDVQVSFVGYESKKVGLVVGELNSVYNLGKIALAQSTIMLDEVQVTEERQSISKSLDKKSFDLADNISQSGGSLLDAMANLPGISIDQEGKVLLRGSDKVAVLIDGNQFAITGFGNQKGLDNIPASNIERIEIINNPSAKHDASGMAGVINIIYKKERQTGFNGDVGLSAGLGALTKRKRDLPSTLGSYNINPKVIPSLNLNYKTSNVNLFLQTEVMRQRNLPNNEFTTRHYTDGGSILSQIPENRMQTHYLVKGGLDWQINERNSFLVSGVYDFENHVDKADVGFFNQENIERNRRWQWYEHETTGLANVTGAFTHQFVNPGQELKATLQYIRGWENEKYFLNETSSYRVGGDTTHVIAKEHVIQLTIDYIQPTSNGRIEAGAKGQVRRLPVTYDVYKGDKSVIYPGLGDWSDWGEDITALYANWVMETSKIDLELGLRGEYTRIFYDISPDNIYYPSNDKYEYWKLYPNVRLTWRINELNRLSAFYNRRIDRPGEAELRIFPKYDDPELLKVGNPYLRPQFTHNFELAYKYFWKTGSIFLSAYYKITLDPYFRIYAIDEQSKEYDIINKVYENTGKNRNIGMELIAEQKINDSWKMSGSFNFFHNHIAAYDGILYFPYERPFSLPENDDNTWYAKMNHQYNIGKSCQIQLSGVYFALMNIPQGRRAARGGIDMGFRKNFRGDKIELLISMRDIFNTMGIKETVYNTGFEAIYENFYETQVVTAGVKVKF